MIKDDFQLDLHTDILNKERIRGRKDYIDLTFEDLRDPYTLPLPDFPGIGGLGPEANFPLLTLHLAKHSFNRPICFVDLLRIMTEEPAFEPEAMMAVAKRWDLLPAVLIPVIFIRECLRTPVPKPLDRGIRNGKWQKRWVVRMVLRNRRFRGLGDYFMMTQIKKGAGGRLRYVEVIPETLRNFARL